VATTLSASATKNQGCDDHKAVNGGGNEPDYCQEMKPTMVMG